MQFFFFLKGREKTNCRMDLKIFFNASRRTSPDKAGVNEEWFSNVKSCNRPCPLASGLRTARYPSASHGLAPPTLAHLSPAGHSSHEWWPSLASLFSASLCLFLLPFSSRHSPKAVVCNHRIRCYALVADGMPLWTGEREGCKQIESRTFQQQKWRGRAAALPTAVFMRSSPCFSARISLLFAKPEFWCCWDEVSHDS